MVGRERMLTRCFSTSATYVGHSRGAANGIKAACQIHSSQCPRDKHKPIVWENSNCGSHGQTGIVPRSPHKETACDVRNCSRHCSLIEGTRVSFMGLLHIMMLGVKAAWGPGWGEGGGGQSDLTEVPRSLLIHLCPGILFWYLVSEQIQYFFKETCPNIACLVYISGNIGRQTVPLCSPANACLAS